MISVCVEASRTQVGDSSLTDLIAATLYRRINRQTVELQSVLISEHSCAAGSAPIQFMTINGQEGPEWDILVVLWILSGTDGLRSGRLDQVVFLNQLSRFCSEKMSAWLVCVVSSHESCVTVTSAPPPSSQT